MPKWIKKTLKILMALVIGGIIIFLSVRGLSAQDKAEIIDAFKQTNYLWIIASLLVAFISNISRTLRWQQLLSPLGYRPSFIKLMLSILVAYFANLGLPRLGEIVRCGLLKKYENIPMEQSLGTVVTERILDLSVFVILFSLNFLIQFQRIHPYIEKEIFSQINYNPSTLIYLLLGGVALTCLLIYGFRKTLQKKPLYKKVSHLIKGFTSGFKSILSIERPLVLLFHSLFIWFCYWLMAYLIFQAIPLERPLGMMEAFSALSIGTIGMILVQGGLGLYPLLIAGTLVSYGLNYPTGYALGWLMWSSQTLGIIVCGIIALSIIPQLKNPGKSQYS